MQLFWNCLSVCNHIKSTAEHACYLTHMHVYFFLNLPVSVCWKLLRLCLVPFLISCDQLSPADQLIKISNLEVWVSPAVVQHLIFSLIWGLGVIFERTRIGRNWFLCFPEEEFIVSLVYIFPDREEKKSFLEAFMLSDHVTGLLYLNIMLWDSMEFQLQFRPSGNYTCGK